MHLQPYTVAAMCGNTCNVSESTDLNPLQLQKVACEFCVNSSPVQLTITSFYTYSNYIAATDLQVINRQSLTEQI